jgi:hypothetical protein
MDAMAREIGDEAHFLFIYTREAHPEHFPEEFPAIDSIERKFANARVMRERHGTPRTMLVDDLDGAVHRQYSGGSNMAYIIDHTGRLHFKANWARELHLRRELRVAIAIRELKRNPDQRIVPYYHEGMSYDPGPRRENRITDEFFENTPARR